VAAAQRRVPVCVRRPVVEVKTAYQLGVSGKEKEAMRRVLRDC
jgi:hypothetical protein